MKINVDYIETQKIGEKIIASADELEEISNKLKSQIENIRLSWMENDSDVTISSMLNYLNSTLYNTIIGIKEYGDCIKKKGNVYNLIHTDYKVKARKTLVESDDFNHNPSDSHSSLIETGN